jgi:hypothetical protein
MTFVMTVLDPLEMSVQLSHLANNCKPVAGEKKQVYTYVIRNNTLCHLTAITGNSGYTMG